MPKTNIFKRAWARILQWVHPPLYVKLDPSDTSVTLSKGLYRHMRLTSGNGDFNKAMMTKVGDLYAIVPNPPFTDQETAIADIQYNPKYRCVGFETNCPTVSRILYDYSLGADKIVLMVSFRRVKEMAVYVIRKPWK